MDKSVTDLTFLVLITTLASLTSVALSIPYINEPNLRIYGGEIAKPGQFPFIVSINDEENGHLCGGTIMNKYWFVTAAHCVIHKNPKDYIVIAGTNFQDHGGTIYEVKETRVHPLYDPIDHLNDVALFRIEGEFVFSDLVQTMTIGEVPDNVITTVIGWGATETDKYPNELRYANLRTLSFENCTKLSQGGRFIYQRGPGQVCGLASEGIAPCHGDSGGPLVFNGTLVGIVSYAITPCAQGFPDVYTRASYYADWIMENVTK